MSGGRRSDALRYRLLMLLALLGATALLYLHWRERDSIAQVEPDRAPTPRSGEWVRHRDAHEVIDAGRCRAQTGGAVETPQPIHRWVDARGVVHFSDRAPAEGEARVERLNTSRAAAPVRISIEARDAVMPPGAMTSAGADAVAIGGVLRDVLGVPTGRGMSLRIVLAGSDAAFRAEAPEARSDFGVYLGDRRMIVLRTHENHETTLDVLRHEIAHALLHEWVGALPTALEEGLADYFEAFRIGESGGSVDPARYAAQLGSDPPPDDGGKTLQRLLALSSAEFHDSDRARHYTWSLGLASTLMATPDRRHALSALLRAQRLQPCATVDAAWMLNRSWPGGLNALEATWRGTHDAGAAVAHAY